MRLSSPLKTAVCFIALASCNNVTGSTSQQPNKDMATSSDHKFMSKEYNRLQDKAMEIAERIEDLVIDADHWVQGQEWTYPTMAVGKIENITATTATAHVTITKHIPDNEESQTQLILPLVFERNDWYIDNMQQYYEGELLDEKAWYQEYVTTHKND